MANATAAWAAAVASPPNRRLVGGLLASLLLHALVLSLQFGIPGLRPGTGGELTVHLAPQPAPPPTQPVTVQAAPALPLAAPGASPFPIVPIPPAPPLTDAPPQAAEAAHARQGFTVPDPIRPRPAPQAAPPPPAARPRRPPRRRMRVPAPRDGLHAKVIAQDLPRDDGFRLPPGTSEPAADATTGSTASASSPAQQAEAPAPAGTQQAAPEQLVERERLAAQRERAREQTREADEQALRSAMGAEARRAAEQQAHVLAQQDANYQDELVRRQRQAEEERRLAEEAFARSRAEEAQREAAVREQATQAARQLAEQERLRAAQQRAQQLAEQLRIQAEQARVRQLAEQRRIAAEQARTQQLAEQLREQQLAEQQRIQAEQFRVQQLAEQQRARQLAEQRDAEEGQRRAQARQRAEQLAREQATQAARLAQQDAGRTEAPAVDGGLDGADAGGTGRSGAALSGSPQGTSLVSRARDLLRGIDIDKPVPQAMRPAEDARRNLRRALAAAESRDVPLRLYVDSIRQKIERNAIIGTSGLSADAVRIFPIVSIAIRSDGSVEDVVIVRSSGHAEIDETVRRIVRLNARYAAFPPNVAANYDVVELRRVWRFAGVLRLLEEMR